MKYKYIVIDGNNLFFRSVVISLKQEIIQNINLQTGGIQYALNKINALIDVYGYQDSTLVYILFDNAESKINIRKIITKGHYKHAREKTNVPKNFYESLNIFEEILKNYSNNYRILFSENLEADDLVKPLLNFVPVDSENKALVVSVDLDWARNLQENVDWYNWTKVYNYDKFYIDYDFIPLGNSIKMYKALHGDASDNIENAVPYLPKETLLYIVNKYNTPEELFNYITNDNIIDNAWKTKIRRAKEKILINYQLVDFIDIDKPISDMMFICEENINQLKIWFDILNLPLESRMLQNLKNDNFLLTRKPYKK